MGNKTPKVYGPAFKKQVVLELMSGVKTNREAPGRTGVVKKKDGTYPLRRKSSSLTIRGLIYPSLLEIRN
jgi:hypothetical protein